MLCVVTPLSICSEGCSYAGEHTADQERTGDGAVCPVLPVLPVPCETGTRAAVAKGGRRFSAPADQPQPDCRPLQCELTSLLKPSLIPAPWTTTLTLHSSIYVGVLWRVGWVTVQISALWAMLSQFGSEIVCNQDDVCCVAGCLIQLPPGWSLPEPAARREIRTTGKVIRGQRSWWHVLTCVLCFSSWLVPMATVCLWTMVVWGKTKAGFPPTTRTVWACRSQESSSSSTARTMAAGRVPRMYPTSSSLVGAGREPS